MKKKYICLLYIDKGDIMAYYRFEHIGNVIEEKSHSGKFSYA